MVPGARLERAIPEGRILLRDLCKPIPPTGQKFCVKYVMPQKDREEYNAYMKEYMLNRYHELRDTWIVKLGGKCIRCGSTSLLEFDHIDPKTKSFTIGKLYSINKEDFQKEVAKCQLLCRSCHESKTIEDNDFNSRKEHGTTASYRHSKCRCDLCKEAWAKMQKIHRTNNLEHGKYRKNCSFCKKRRVCEIKQDAFVCSECKE